MRRFISLDGIWFYWADYNNECKDLDGKAFETQLEDFVDSKEWKKCRIPSVWNKYEPALSRFYGSVFFKTSFKTPEHMKNCSLLLNFGGINYKATIWINGKFFGDHEAGYTSFTIEISEFLKEDKRDENELVICVDNSWGHDDRLPWVKTVDFFNYGGIFRPVSLEVVPKLSIFDYTIKDSIEFPDAGASSPSKIEMTVDVIVENELDIDYSGRLFVDIFDPVSTKYVLFAIEELKVDASTAFSFPVIIPVKPSLVKLWSPENPNLYKINIRLESENGITIDEQSWRWGFKKLEIRGTKFFLNNKQIFLRGTNKHEDHPDYGMAVPAELQYADLLKMKEANINCFRGSHYPQSEALLDLCDELGFLYVEEVPAYSLPPEHLANEKILETAKRYFYEMYIRDKNHTCILAWSVSNETHTQTGAGRKFHEEMFKYARKLDPGRFVIFVSNKAAMDACFGLTDFICMNIYAGWYSGDYKDLKNMVGLVKDIMMDEDREYGEPKPIVLTEFGAGAIPGYRSWDLLKWSEDFQANLLEYYINFCMENREFIGGTWIWLFHDFQVDLPARPDGRPRSYNNKGMVSEFRQQKVGYGVVKRLYAKWKELEGSS
ncbi:MAG: glycoside hydrolase family 2 protein [Candidatus Hodarchaeota archaeon]